MHALETERLCLQPTVSGPLHLWGWPKLRQSVPFAAFNLLLKESWLVVGQAALHVSEINNQPEAAVFVRLAHQWVGRGFSSEAVEALAALAGLQTPRLVRTEVVNHTAPENEPELLKLMHLTEVNELREMRRTKLPRLKHYKNRAATEEALESALKTLLL